MKNKICRLCNKGKPIESYSIRNKQTNSRRTECKSCLNEKRRKSKSYRKWADKNKEHLKKYERSYRLKKKYGITLDDYNKMLTDQDNKCAICKTSKPLPNKKSYNGWHVDHCHTTGKIRGILCHTCNPSLGAFKDDINILKNAIKYLQNEGH